MLGRNDEAAYYLARYRAAFPQAHARWPVDFHADDLVIDNELSPTVGP
jgi:hypothetical protein